jgi:hypothetical protein
MLTHPTHDRLVALGLGVQLVEREEASVPQFGQHEPLDNQNRNLDLRFVAWLPHPRRQHHEAIVVGQILIGAVDARLVTRGLGDAGLEVVAHRRLRHAAAYMLGVVTLHADLSAALEQRGIKVTVLRAGAQKMAANPFEPLADDTIQRLLGDLEAARTTFAQNVGRYRGNRFTSQAALATEAQDYRGSDAVALGLADATGHALEAFDGFVRAINANN